ncbi:general stress protein [Corynebacterium sp. H130]|uniref:general stress protein n=1 Tax=Corynebacterium sp. H130 TaxID=3133444 RepID=UPI0030A235D0
MQPLTPDSRPLPTGWPIGSFGTYVEAQAAVDMLSDTGDFPVSELTIVGVNLMEVERVMGRLSWGRVLAGGAASGAWMGVFFGLLMGLFSDQWVAPLIAGVCMGVFFGMTSAAAGYARTAGRRDFSSRTQIVAGRYDVLCAPDHARAARDLISQANLAGKLKVD